MKKFFTVFVLALLAGCSSAPAPKQPDISHPVAVNKTVPLEASQGVLQ